MDEIENEIINKSYTQLISDGFKLYAHNFLKLVLVWLVFTSLTILIDVFIVSYLTSRYFSSIALYIFFSLVGSVILSVISVITMCSVSIYLFEDYLQKDPDFNESFKNAFNERIKYPMIVFIIINLIGDSMMVIWFIMEVHVGISLSLFLINIIFIVIGIITIIIWTYYIFSIFTYNIEEIEKPLNKAMDITKGSFWKVLIILLIPTLIILFARTLFALIFGLIFYGGATDPGDPGDPSRQLEGFFLLRNFFISIPIILFGSLGICLLTPLFTQLYMKKIESK